MVRIWSHGIELPKGGHRALKVGQAQKQYLAEVQALFSSHEYRSIILSNQSHRHTEFGDLECPGRLHRHWPAWGQVARLPRITGISLQGKRFRSLVEPDSFMVLQISLSHRDGKYGVSTEVSSYDLLFSKSSGSGVYPPLSVIWAGSTISFQIEGLILVTTFSQDISGGYQLRFSCLPLETGHWITRSTKSGSQKERKQKNKPK